MAFRNGHIDSDFCNGTAYLIQVNILTRNLRISLHSKKIDLSVKPARIINKLNCLEWKRYYLIRKSSKLSEKLSLLSLSASKCMRIDWINRNRMPQMELFDNSLTFRLCLNMSPERRIRNCIKYSAKFDNLGIYQSIKWYKWRIQVSRSVSCHLCSPITTWTSTIFTMYTPLMAK